MIFPFDFKTLLAVILLGNVFTLLLVFAYRYRHPKDPATLCFLVSRLVQAAAWCCLLIRESLPVWAAVPLNNFLFLAGGGLELVTLIMLRGKFTLRMKRLFAGLSAFGIFGFGYLFLMHNLEYLRIAFVSLISACFVAVPAWVFLSERQASPLQKTIGYLYGGVSVVLAGRAALALAVGPGMNVFSENGGQTLFYLAMYLFMILGTAAFALLSRERAYEELKKVATYDDLTGILNRRSFMIGAELLLEEASRKGHPVSFLLMDIDRFKEINDTYGHTEGDRVLRKFAGLVERNLGPADLFGRYGGEEFAVLMAGLDEQACSRAAERLRKAVAEGSVCEGEPGCTVSIGTVTAFPEQATGLEDLYALSDKALYEAKQRGRDRVVSGFVPTAGGI